MNQTRAAVDSNVECKKEEITSREKKQRSIKRNREEEQELITLLKRGDPDGLRKIMRNYHEWLFSVAYGICSDVSDAEEALQDVYMTATNKIHKFEQRSTLSTWLYRITVNASLMKRRSQRRHKMKVSTDTIISTRGEEGGFLLTDEETDSPEEALLNKELWEKVHDSVEDISPIYKDVFALRDVQGFSIKETSKILETSSAAVKSRLHRGRFFIREKLGGYLFEN